MNQLNKLLATAVVAVSAAAAQQTYASGWANPSLNDNGTFTTYKMGSASQDELSILYIMATPGVGCINSIAIAYMGQGYVGRSKVGDVVDGPDTTIMYRVDNGRVEEEDAAHRQMNIKESKMHLHLNMYESIVDKSFVNKLRFGDTFKGIDGPKSHSTATVDLSGSNEAINALNEACFNYASKGTGNDDWDDSTWSSNRGSNTEDSEWAQ